MKPSRMNPSGTRTAGSMILQLAIVFATTATLLASSIGAASAQVEVVGTADFRNAPALAPGQYIDTIVSGDSAWYALVYTNDTPYRFEVSIPGAPASANRDLTLEASFIAPTLETVGESAPVVSGSGVTYPSGNTNIWFLKVSVNTSGTVGLEYRVVIDIEGVESTGFDDCSADPSCTFDEELGELESTAATLRADLDAVLAQPAASDLELEITNLEGFAESANSLRPAAEARLSRAEAQMAVLCAPEPMCDTFPDPGTKTPLIGWAVGGLALIGGAFRGVQKLRKDDDESQGPPADQPVKKPTKKASTKR